MNRKAVGCAVFFDRIDDSDVLEMDRLLQLAQEFEKESSSDKREEPSDTVLEQKSPANEPVTRAS